MSLLKHVRSKALAGILLILPVGVTVYLLLLIFRVVDSILSRPISEFASHVLERKVSIPGVGVLAFFILIYVAGIIATNVVGRGFAYLSHRFFMFIPLAKSIYSAAKQLTLAFSPERETFRQVAFVEFPSRGCYTIGFLTNEVTDAEGKSFAVVFVPTTPNPTTGFVFIVPKERIILSPIGMEQAVQSVMSGGFVFPSAIDTTLPSQ